MHTARSLVLVAMLLGTVAVAAERDRAAALRLLAVEPTVFVVKTEGGLRQVAEATVENRGTPVAADLEIGLPGAKHSAALGQVPQGRATVQFQVPEIDRPATLEFALRAGSAVHDRRTVAWQPQRHWEVCFVPITHHDLGYTDTLENVLRRYDGFYDNVLRYCAETADWPADAQYRYTAEGSWSVQHFLRARPRAVAEQLGRYARQGRIEVSALYGNPIGALHGHEELIRLLYPSFQLKRELGVPVRSAAITDVPGLAWGLPTMLADAGVKYFFAGLPTYFQWDGRRVHDFWDEAAILPHGRPDAFRWQGPDGRSVLVYYQGGYGHFVGGIGPNAYEEIAKHLPGKLRAIERGGSPLSVVRYIHNGVDNFPPSMEISRLVRRWNERWAFPRLIVSTNAMFFERLERQASGLRTLRGELPDTDYVVGASSTPLEAGVNRMAHDRLLAADKFTAMAGVLAGYPRRPEHEHWITKHTHYPDVRQALATGYENAMLFDEHTWGMAHQAGTQQDWDWSDKSRFAYKAAGLADSLLAGSLGTLADAVSLARDGRHFVVFNALPVPRSDVVRVSAKDAGYGRFTDFMHHPFALVDLETNAEIPYQIVKLDSPRAPVPYAAQRYARGQFNAPEQYELVFVADAVPPLGWKTYRMVVGQQPAFSGPRVARGENRLESARFRLTVDPQSGAVASLYDKQHQREMVDRQAPHGLNQLVVRHVRDGRLESPTPVTIRPGQHGPVYSSLIISGVVDTCPQVTQEVIVYDKLARVDLANRVLKDSTPAVELYFAFPFQAVRPEFRFEGPLSVIRPLVDQLPGSNGNYYAVQHWAHLADGPWGVTLAAVESHLLEFGGLWPCYVSQAHHGVTPPDFGQPFVRRGQIERGHMYAFVHDANFRTNFAPLEQADLLFRYALTAGPGDWTQGGPRDFGWAAGNPLQAIGVDGPRRGTLPQTLSFCQATPANAFVLTLKPAEDGRGLILRLLETAGRTVQATVTLPRLTIGRAWQTNLVEEDLAKLTCTEHQVTVPLKAFGVTTLRIQPR